MRLIPSLNNLSISDLSLVALPTSKFASGTVTTSSSAIAFYGQGDTTTPSLSNAYAQVSGLQFVPTRIIIETVANGAAITLVDTQKDFSASAQVCRIIQGNNTAFQLMGNAYVDATGFKVPAAGNSVACKWYAYA